MVERRTLNCDFDGTLVEPYNTLGRLFGLAGEERLGGELSERYVYYLDGAIRKGKEQSAEEEMLKDRVDALYRPVNEYERWAFSKIPPEALGGIYREGIEDISDEIEIKPYVREVLFLADYLGWDTGVVSMNYCPEIIEDKLGGLVDGAVSPYLEFYEGVTTGRIEPGIVAPEDKKYYSGDIFVGDGPWDIPAILYSKSGFLVGEDERTEEIIEHLGPSQKMLKTEEDVGEALNNPGYDVYRLPGWEVFYRYLRSTINLCGRGKEI